VEDGRPFCPNCHAPQIKVPVRPPTAPVTEPLPPGTPEDLQPPAEPMTGERASFEISPAHSFTPQPENKLLWRPAFSAALVAGLLAAVGTSIPIIPLAMLCMFASGGLAVTIYRRRSGHRPVSPWMGSKLGLLAGGWGFGLLTILSTFLLLTANGRTELRATFRGMMQEAAEKAAASTADPVARHAMEEFRGYVGTDQGLIVMVLISVAIAAVFFLAVSALGGALGAALFGREGGHKEQ
jgi:hypothetical protein